MTQKKTYEDRDDTIHRGTLEKERPAREEK